MMVTTPVSALSAECDDRRARVRDAFDSGESAGATLQALCQLADQTVLKVFGQLFSATSPKGISLIAIGGYGTQLLFPYSDLDVLFLFESETIEEQLRPQIGELSRTLWDAGFKSSFAGRTLQECKRIEEDNVEFHLSLLGRRFLVGDSELYKYLQTRILRSVERRSREFLISRIAQFTRERHARYGNTIFHLEPNVKEVPGGLRDYHAAHWLDALAGNPGAEPEEIKNAAEFMSAARCFLHYVNGRNDNSLTYELQAKTAERFLGVKDIPARDPAEWMRIYFRHARALNRQLLSRLELLTTKRSLLRRRLAALSAQGQSLFFTHAGKLELEKPDRLKSRDQVFSLLASAAETGLPLSREAEKAILQPWQQDGAQAKEGREAWMQFRVLLGAPYPAVALRTMHRLGLLSAMLPEFQAIDALVVRDFYHRYTVDEHSLRTIEHLQELAAPPDSFGVQFSSLWKAVRQRNLLIFALLLHDVGKGMANEDHVIGSLEALESAAARLGLNAEEKDEVHFLIEQHLAMSATLQRRDIFDPATISAFANVVATQERLDRLCLLTYADIHAVNPEALTPWKAAMLFQLFVATSNHLSRSLDSDRVHVGREIARVQEIPWPPEASRSEIEQFLEGFPRRYLAVHSPEEIAGHFSLYRKLGPGQVQTELRATQNAFALTILTADRPALFATISGVVAGWGMNIVKADAFANAAGIVLDTFHFIDLYHTLELNPGESERFRRSLADVIGGKASLERLLAGRITAHRARKPKVEVETSIRFDVTSSPHCTLLEILTQDHPGFLYQVGTVLARLGCNIEVALINTEGQKIIDVFYLTKDGAKLNPETQQRLLEEISTIGP